MQSSASITDDTLRAMSRDGQVMLPSDSISQLWTRKVSPIRTLGLMGGLAAGLLVVAAIAVAGSELTFYGP